MEFELQADYKPTGDQPQAIKIDDGRQNDLAIIGSRLKMIETRIINSWNDARPRRARLPREQRR